MIVLNILGYFVRNKQNSYAALIKKSAFYDFCPGICPLLLD